MTALRWDKAARRKLISSDALAERMWCGKFDRLKAPVQGPARPRGAPAGERQPSEEARQRLSDAIWAEVWTDGSCEPNPGRMGYGLVIVSDVGRVELSGGGQHGTNSRAELMAAILALDLPTSCRAVVRSDSTYIVNGMTKWLPGWRRQKWLRHGAPIPNADRWKRLDVLARSRDLEWFWVRGHAVDPNNNRAEQLAEMGRRNRQ